MKVLQINSVCGIRSTGRICTDIAEVLMKNGDESFILYGRETAPQKYKSISKKITTNKEVKFHALFSRIFDKTGFYSKRATKRIIKEIELYNPDIIHLHNLHGYYLDVELLFSYLKKCGKPIVWTLHDCWAFTGHCSHFSFVNCNKWKTGCFNCPQKKQYPTSLIFDNSKKNYKKKKDIFTGVKNLTIVTPSSWLKGEVEQSFLSEYEVFAIPNGIDLESFKPNSNVKIRNKYGLDDKKIILGVASAWSNRKGLTDFVKLSRIINDDYKIVLVGVDEQQKIMLPEEILALSSTNSKEELCELYSSAYVFLNPSREETMGLTTVEALASGTPVIVYNLTALPEVVDTSCGFVVNDINDVISVLPKIKNIDKHNCIFKAQQYDKEKMFKKYIEIYKDMVK